jgi:hypothetical protein
MQLSKGLSEDSLSYHAIAFENIPIHYALQGASIAIPLFHLPVVSEKCIGISRHRLLMAFVAPNGNKRLGMLMRLYLHMEGF